MHWAADKFGKKPDEVASDIAELVCFAPVKNLFYVAEEVNKARRFKNAFKNLTGIVNSHIFEVSEEFPNAIFLLEYDDIANYCGKQVIRAGDVLRDIFDRKRQALDWALLDIFAPYVAEWAEELEVGSLWESWMKDVTDALEGLRQP